MPKQIVWSPLAESDFANILERKNTIGALKSAIQEGIESGIANDFNSEAYLEGLKAKKNPNVKV